MVNDCRILGMDNSTRSTGWAVIDVVAGVPKLVDYGLIKRGSMDMADVLVEFETTFTDLLERFKPDHVSAEQMFIGANRTTAMSLGYVHGVMLLTARKREIPVTYYSVMTAKSVTLGGIKLINAKGKRKTSEELKLEVQAKVFDVLGKANFTHEYTDDVTDACSLALTFAYTDGVSGEKRSEYKGTGKRKKAAKAAKKVKRAKPVKQRKAKRTTVASGGLTLAEV